MKTILLLLGFFISASTFAATYTATASGNWSNSSTWVGGTAPSFNIASDAVIIPVGISVNLDQSATFTGNLSSLDLEGALTSSPGKSLNMDVLSTLSGGASGTLNIGSLSLQASSNFTFSGNAIVDTLNTSETNLLLAANLTVSKVINLAGGILSVFTNGVLTLSPNAFIIISGGALATNGGILGLSSTYNVVYTTVSTISGLELSGAGLNNIAIALPASSGVTLSSDLLISGTLKLDSGRLIVGAKTLTINGAVIAGNGNVESSAVSVVNITTPGGITGPLNFGDSSKVSSMEVNTGPNTHAYISGNLTILDALNLTTGLLSFDSINLVINGLITGTGALSADSLSNITLTRQGPNAISFAPGGQTVNNLTLATGFANYTTLASNLTVHGLLNMQNYTQLIIEGDTLILNGNVQSSGTFKTNSNTSFIVNSSTNIIAPLNIIGPVLGTLTINVGQGNLISVLQDLYITNALNLQSGTLNVGGSSLTISGIISGPGSVLTNSSSNIVINTVAGTGGVLRFANGSSAGNFSINVGIGNTTQIGGSLNIIDTLSLTSGILNLGNSNISLFGILLGTGSLSGSDSSNLSIQTAAGLNSQIIFAAGGQTLNNFTINADSGNSVILGTRLVVKGTLGLSNGAELNISQDSLFIAGNMSGSGILIVNPQTALLINTSAGLSSLVKLVGPIGTFVVNTGATTDSVVLGGDLRVVNALSLQQGVLVLNGFNLAVSGDISAGGAATISSNNQSDIIINTTNSITGGLSFTSGANTVNSFALHTTGELHLNSNLVVDSGILLSYGKIHVGEGDTLMLANGGKIYGYDSSAYVITGHNGALGLYINQGDTSWTHFAIGTPYNYAPVALQLNAGSDGGIVYATVDTGVYAQGISGSSLSAQNSLVSATWMVEPAFTSHVDLNIRAMWSPAMEANYFNRDSAYISHYTNGSWDMESYTTARSQTQGYFSLQRNGISSFSPFAVFGKRIDTTTTVIHLVSDNGKFEIYPNPAKETLLVKNINGSEVINLDIVNITGQVILSYKLTDYLNSICLSSLSAGTYVVKLYNDKQITALPFVKM